jgi:ATP-dependent helicase HrpB
LHSGALRKPGIRASENVTIPLNSIIRGRRVCFRDLVLERRQAGEPSPDAAAALLADRVFHGELKLKQWNHAVDSWLARVECLRAAMPELELPIFTEEDYRMILTEICHGASTYKQIKDRPVLPVVKQWLSPPMRAAIETLAPEQITLGNGTRAKVDYVTDPEPSISVVLQRLYDVTQTPAIANGRLALLVKILAPNQRPVQITHDLQGFWDNSYPAIRTQWKGRYPKHEWR